MNTLLAGRDTTAATLTWLFYELSFHPEFYRLLREEVLRVLGKEGRPSYEDLKNMKFLQYCINESKFCLLSSFFFFYVLRIVPVIIIIFCCCYHDHPSITALHCQ